MKKKASRTDLNVTSHVSLGNKWFALVFAILGARSSDILPQCSPAGTAASHTVNVYQARTSSGACAAVQNDHRLVQKWIELSDVALVIHRSSEKARWFGRLEQLEPINGDNRQAPTGSCYTLKITAEGKASRR